MAVKIRLRVQGRKNQSYYRIVVIDSKAPRNGKYLEMLGWYNPHEEKNKTEINKERLAHWVSVGAEMTPKVASLVKRYQADVVKPADKESVA